jgi:ADP-heptose:LPS heptosyltransferase
MRILFISYTRLGDAVLSTGLLDALHQRYPEARFTIACGPVAAPVFEAFPALERLVVMRKGPYLAHWRTLLGACFSTFWDLIVDLRGSASAWVLPTRRRRIFSGGSNSGHRIDLAGTEPLGVLAALLARSALYIGNDSGLMHLAAAAGAPTLGLFGPSRDEQYRPWGAQTAIVRTDRDYETLRRDPGFCKDPEDSLMWDLPVDRVVAAAERLLAGKS